MEMEKINENTIRVKLSKEDLLERDISVLDLIGNQKDVEQFFYNLLDEVDIDHEFRDNGAVTFQLVPSGEGIELFITKVSPGSAEKLNLPDNAKLDDNNNVILSNVSADELDKIGLDKDVTNILKEKLNKSESDKSKASNNVNIIYPSNTVKAFKFYNFEDFLNLTHDINNVNNNMSSLFIMDNEYYLVIYFNKKIKDIKFINNFISKIYEFGDAINFAPLILQERGHLIKSKNAIEWAKENF